MVVIYRDDSFAGTMGSSLTCMLIKRYREKAEPIEVRLQRAVEEKREPILQPDCLALWPNHSFYQFVRRPSALCSFLSAIES